jgi:hypothetical protein
MSSIPLADGPAMYFGGTIMTFALPYGAFIVAAVALYYLFRNRHAGVRLKYLATAPFNSLGTREPGPVPAPPVAASAPEPVAATATATVAEPAAVADAESAESETNAEPEAGE